MLINSKIFFRVHLHISSKFHDTCGLFHEVFILTHRACMRSLNSFIDIDDKSARK